MRDCILEQQKIEKKLESQPIKLFTELKKQISKIQSQCTATACQQQEHKDKVENAMFVLREEYNQMIPKCENRINSLSQTLHKDACEFRQLIAQLQKQNDLERIEFRREAHSTLDEFMKKTSLLQAENLKKISDLENQILFFREEQTMHKKTFGFLKEQIADQKRQLQTKLGPTELNQIDVRIKELPSKDDFSEFRHSSNVILQAHQDSLKTFGIKLEESLLCVSRYDEVLSQKAQKHSVA